MFFSPSRKYKHPGINRAEPLPSLKPINHKAMQQTGNLIQQKTDPAEELVHCQINEILSAAAC